MAFLHQNQYISLRELFETSDVSTGDVLTVSHALITKAGFVPTLLRDTGLLIGRCFLQSIDVI